MAIGRANEAMRNFKGSAQMSMTAQAAEMYDFSDLIEEGEGRALDMPYGSWVMCHGSCVMCPGYA